MAIRQSLKQLAGVYELYAESSGSKWPFVTLKNYEHYAGLAREASGLEMINIALNVQEDDRLAFLNYTDVNYQAWIEESHKINPEYAKAFHFWGRL